MQKKTYKTWIRGENGVPELVEDQVRTNNVKNLMMEVYGPDMKAKKEEVSLAK